MRRLAVVVLAACGGAAAPSVVPPAAEQPAARAPAPALSFAPAPASTPTPAPVAGCPSDMAAVAGFCIDRYEAPNVPGAMPYALQTAYDGEAWCAERGKRLCAEQEWRRACEGASGRRYPYGDSYRPGACNDDRVWREVHWSLLAKWPDAVAVEEARRLYQGEASGARAACVTDDGVHDLTGNVAEWVRREGPPPHPGWDHVLKGCYWAGCYHEPHPNCEFTNHAHPGTFRTYEAGFRCCSDRSSGVTSAP